MTAISEPWLPLPLVRTCATLLRTLPMLMGTAFTCAGVFLAVCFATATFARYIEPVAMWIWLLALLAVLHALYLVFASRIVADDCDLGVKKLGALGWLRTVLTVLVLTAAVGVAIKAFTTMLLPAHSGVAVFVGIVALMAFTPVLPMIAAEGRSVGSALGDSAPDLFRFFFCALVTALPFLIPVGVVALPLFGCTACWGLFEGGIITIPIFCACVFLAATAMALVPTVVYAAMKPTMEFAGR